MNEILVLMFILQLGGINFNKYNLLTIWESILILFRLVLILI